MQQARGEMRVVGAAGKFLRLQREARELAQHPALFGRDGICQITAGVDLHAGLGGVQGHDAA